MKALELAIQVERTVAQIYSQLARRFREDGELRALFTMLREEELAHARRVELVQADFDEEEAWSLALEEVRFSQLRERAEHVLSQVLERPSLSAKQAIGLAVKLEENFQQVHAQALAAETNPKLAEMLRDLVAWDSAHRALLERYSK